MRIAAEYGLSFVSNNLLTKPRDYQGKRVNPHITLLPKVIPLKLFLDMVPSSFSDVTRPLRGCFRWGFVFVSSFRSERKPQTLLGCKIYTLIISWQNKMKFVHFQEWSSRNNYDMIFCCNFSDYLLRVFVSN